MATQVPPVFFRSILTCSALAAEVKLGPERIGARTDGGLQIFLRMAVWLLGIDPITKSHSRYLFTIITTIKSQAKRFFKTKREKDGSEKVFEVDDPDDSIHAGQVFAEMLGAVCHPEFFDYCDLEVFLRCIGY